MKVKIDKLTIDTIIDIKSILVKNNSDENKATEIISEIINNNMSKSLLYFYNEYNSNKISENEFNDKIYKEILKS